MRRRAIAEAERRLELAGWRWRLAELAANERRQSAKAEQDRRRAANELDNALGELIEARLNQQRGDG